MKGSYRFSVTAASILLALVVFQNTANASGTQVAFEQQVYPTGIIPGVRFERGFARRSSVHFRIGYQEIRHEDFGVHDDERGDGAGFSLGYSRFLNTGFTGWAFGVRSDLWFNRLDWIDDEGTPEELSGTTQVTVLQPTVDVSYRFLMSNNFFITPSLAAGFEINIDTDGEDVGEGFIVLLGLIAGFNF